MLTTTTAVELVRQRDHPQRRWIMEEMHLRRFPGFSAPARILQVVILTADLPGSRCREHAESLLAHYGLPAAGPGKYLSARLGAVEFIWEQHSEFASYTFIEPGAYGEPFGAAVLEQLPRDWVAALPGQTLRATQIALLDKSAGEPSPQQLAQWFRPEELVCCDVQGGEARIWSNFRSHGDGLGRLLIQDRGLIGDGDPSRLVQRLQDLSNYRNMALLGLPVAQHFTPMLTQLERSLAGLSREISAGNAADEELMQRVSQLAADLANLTAETSYRMSATKAYAQLVGDRLQALRVVRVPGFQNLNDFTERRLTPAVRTCDSFWRRAEELSEHAAWTSSLMRMRIETALEQQNRDLLKSMNRRAHLQLRLQHAVEGLSVIAISYYATGLLGYVIKSLSHVLPGLDPNVALGVCVPVVLLVGWLLMRRFRRNIERGSP